MGRGGVITREDPEAIKAKPGRSSESVLDSSIHDCVPVGRWAKGAITKLVVALGASLLGCVGDCDADDADDEITVLFKAQSRICCQQTMRSSPRELDEACQDFHDRYQALIWSVVGRVCPGMAWHDREDLCQKIWGKVFKELPKLEYDPAEAKLRSWIAEVARQHARGIGTSVAPWWLRGSSGDADLDTLPGQQCRTDEGCLLVERQQAATAIVAEACQGMSPENRELFVRWFVERQTAGQIAVEMGLTAATVYCRCRRMRWAWLAAVEAWNEWENGDGAACGSDTSRILSILPMLPRPKS
jgi:RNA polymerase sigma factor (sigma-70 family)